jgi:hypothetical protein
MSWPFSWRSRTLIAPLSLLVAVAAGAACNTGSPGSPNSNPTKQVGSTGGTPAPPYTPPLAPFSPDTPFAYVAKVKNILIGLPATDTEIESVSSESTLDGQEAALKTLIDGWMKVPDPNNTEGMTYFQEKMLVFFKLAFQQTQVAATDFSQQVLGGQGSVDTNPTYTNLLVQNLTESFARTMIALTGEGKPLNSAMTTTSFMMTPALMELYAFLDAWEIDDNQKYIDAWATQYPKQPVVVESGTTIDPTDSATPGNKDFMHWQDPDIATEPAGCGGTTFTFASMSAIQLHDFLYGTLPKTKACAAYTPKGTVGQMLPTDFTTWKMVTIRQPGESEQPTWFFDLNTMRTSSELVLSVPRVGFFSTPAFAANWQTNSSNMMRVTMNQTLIVALGKMMDGTDTTATPYPVSQLGAYGLDETHAIGKCVGCHQLLDPMRAIFASNYSWFYHAQTYPTTWAETIVDGKIVSGQPVNNGFFAFGGYDSVTQKAPYKTLSDLGSVLSNHPAFASAWVQKLSYYVNSQPDYVYSQYTVPANNTPTDPEFTRIVTAFQTSNYSWSTLVEELLSSPLTTNAARTTTTTQEGVIAAVSRRDHLCAALNFRLGFQDICGLLPTTKANGIELQTIVKVAGGLPSDGYGRGATAPVLPNQPSLFFRAGTENICESVAELIIDVKTAKQVPGVTYWTSTTPALVTTAITDFVQQIMAITPKNPIYADVLSTLQDHYASALAVSGTTTTSALQSTFTVACLSPSFVGIGMQ